MTTKPVPNSHANIVVIDCDFCGQPIERGAKREHYSDPETGFWLVFHERDNHRNCGEMYRFARRIGLDPRRLAERMGYR